jgi:hypothetical protein
MSHIALWPLAGAVFFRIVEAVNGAEFGGNAVWLPILLRRERSAGETEEIAADESAGDEGDEKSEEENAGE